jgi:hypothetical protein
MRPTLGLIGALDTLVGMQSASLVAAEGIAELKPNWRA